jgi:hypothetical protein
MAFRLASHGGTSGDEWIVADGKISSETPKLFREFLSDKKIKKGARYEVYLNSPGGNLIAGIELGEIIREFGFGTRVASSIKNGAKLNNYELENEGVGRCYSACSFAFLGGKWRIAADRTLGVHQYYRAEFLKDAFAKNFNALDLSKEQVIAGILADYVVRMGIDARFLTLASKASPYEMYLLSLSELKQFEIVWNDQEYADWIFHPYKNGIVAISKSRNGERIATLFCRKDGALRLLINIPYVSNDPDADTIVKGAGVSLFGEDIPDIKGRTENGRLLLEFKLPPWHKLSDGDAPPRKTTPAATIKFLQQMSRYHPSTKEWDAIAYAEKHSRQMRFENFYRESFGSTPSYNPDGSPIIPKFSPPSSGMTAGGTNRYFFYHNLPQTRFLTYAKHVGRNCI